MAVATLRLKGDKELIRRLKKLGAAGPIAAGNALKREAEDIMADSKEHYVPVDKGTLKGSGYVDNPKISAHKVTVEMGYGGAASAYALAVHEHLSEHSPISWIIAEAEGGGVDFNVGGPKYLELPVLAAKRGMARRIANDIKQHLKAVR